VEQIPAPTFRCLAVLSHGPEFLEGHTKPCCTKIVVLQHGAEASKVSPAIEKGALAVLPVPACTTGLLVIGLKCPWQAVVDHKPYIRLVDTHSECHGCADDLYIAFEKGILDGVADRLGKPGVISEGPEPSFLQIFGDLLSLFPAHTVDDTGRSAVLAKVMLEENEWIFLFNNAILEVDPVETPDKFPGPDKSQLVNDIMANFRHSCCSQRNNRNIGIDLPDLGELPVLRPERVTPLGYTMCLINCDEPDR
jgi:hypothetical protein